LKKAHSHASKLGRPLNQLVSIHWGLAPTGVSPQERMKRMQELMRKWFHYRNERYLIVWVHEQGLSKSLHTHALIHIPDQHLKAFEVQLQQWVGKKVAAKTIDIRPADCQCIGYILKDVKPEHYEELNILQSHAQKRSSKSTPVKGKRAGTSQNLGPKARADYASTRKITRSKSRLSPPHISRILATLRGLSKP